MPFITVVYTTRETNFRSVVSSSYLENGTSLVQAAAPALPGVCCQALRFCQVPPLCPTVGSNNTACSLSWPSRCQTLLTASAIAHRWGKSPAVEWKKGEGGERCCCFSLFFSPLSHSAEQAFPSISYPTELRVQFHAEDLTWQWLFKDAISKHGG